MAVFKWFPGPSVSAGSDPSHGVEINGELIYPDDSSSVIVGVGARVNDDNVTTLRLWVAPILDDGTLGEPVERRYGSAPDHALEAWGMVGFQEVVVGVGGRVQHNSLVRLRLWARRLNARTGKLWGDLKYYDFGSAPNADLEAYWYSEDDTPTEETRLVTGVGMRVGDGNLTTLRLETGNIAAIGIDTTGLKLEEKAAVTG